MRVGVRDWVTTVGWRTVPSLSMSTCTITGALTFPSTAPRGYFGILLYVQTGSRRVGGGVGGSSERVEVDAIDVGFASGSRAANQAPAPPNGFVLICATCGDIASATWRYQSASS